MRVRHKMPMVFTLAMVDVLCCALGCVILIWLLNSKLDADHAVEMEEERQALLQEARETKAKSDALLAEARGDTTRLDARLRLIVQERDRALALVAKLNERVAQLESDRLTLLAALDREQKDVTALKGRLNKSAEKTAVLEKDLRTLLGNLEREKKGAADLKGLLKQAGEKSAILEGDLKALVEKYNKERTVTVKLNTDLAALLARIKVTEQELTKAKDREKEEKTRAELLTQSLTVKQRDLLALTKLLEEAKKVSDTLKKSLDLRDLELAKEKEGKIDLEKLLRLRDVALEDAGKTLKRLEAEKLVLRTAVDNRFAGIELTGQRVIFLVDISGSMMYLDSRTKAPDKWREVRETISKLMKSMPGLKQYQIITFSRTASYPLGSPERWLDYDRAESPGKALKALEAITPADGTNMYAGLEESFRYRLQGLDTVYVLSDGLPNLGEGLTAAEAARLSELERGLVLGRHIRNKLEKEWNRPLPGRARVKIHTIGFFFESPDLGSFLWSLARENEGSFVGMSRP